MACLGGKAIKEKPASAPCPSSGKALTRKSIRRLSTVTKDITDDTGTSKLLTRSPSFVVSGKSHAAPVTIMCPHKDSHGHPNLHRHLYVCILCQAACYSRGEHEGDILLPTIHNLLVSIDSAWNTLWIWKHRFQFDSEGVVQGDGEVVDQDEADLERAEKNEIMVTVADLTNQCLLPALQKAAVGLGSPGEWHVKTLRLLDQQDVWMHYFTHRDAVSVPSISEKDAADFASMVTKRQAALLRKW